MSLNIEGNSRGPGEECSLTVMDGGTVVTHNKGVEGNASVCGEGKRGEIGDVRGTTLSQYLEKYNSPTLFVSPM